VRETFLNQSRVRSLGEQQRRAGVTQVLKPGGFGKSRAVCLPIDGIQCEHVSSGESNTT
jgi:hypothetical protein